VPHSKLAWHLERTKGSTYLALGVTALALTAVTSMTWSTRASVASVAVVCGALVVGAVFRARRLTTPPEVAAVVVRGELQGRECFWIRVWLGAGRPIHDASVRVSDTSDRLQPLELNALVPRVQGVVGPWTVLATNPTNAVVHQITVQFDVREADKIWHVERVFHAHEIRDGRFAAPVAPTSPLSWRRDQWDEVISPPTG